MFRNLFTICLLPLLFGCGGERKEQIDVPDARQAEDHIENAFSQVKGDMRFNYALANKDIARELTSWANGLDEDIDWQRPKLVETLPKRILDSPANARLEEMRFTNEDSIYIQEAAWAQTVAKLNTEKRTPGNFRYLITAARKSMNAEELADFSKSKTLLRSAVGFLHPDLNDKVADEAAIRFGAISDLDKLTRVIQLFDWTVRNVQLNKLPPKPTADDIQRKSLSRAEKTIASLAGVGGPGYQRQPFHLFTSGQGDAIEKSRLFIRLINELDVPAAIIAVEELVDDEDESSDEAKELVPWAVGVSIGEHIFLFDMQLGLPIPGPELKGIATLKQVVDDPTLLSDLDLKPAESFADIDYPIAKSQLDQIVALVDAPEQALSKRMSALESVLNRKQRLKLAIDAEKIAKPFEECKQIDEVRLWEIPFLAAEFRAAVDAARAKNSPQLEHVAELARENLLDMKVALKKERDARNVDINAMSSGKQVEKRDEFEVVGLSESRQRFLTGVYSLPPEERKKGASQLYNQLLLTDEQIRGFDTNDQWKAMYGLNEQSNLSVVDYANALEAVKAQLRLIRTDATYFLSLTHYESGNAMNAMRWLQRYQGKRKQNARATEWDQWQHSVQYLLGRSHETLLEFDQAVEAYDNGGSTSRKRPKAPQHQGNMIRVRMLKKWAMSKK